MTQQTALQSSNGSAMEIGARAYCEARRLNPDESVMYRLPNAVGFDHRPRWQSVAVMLEEYIDHETALKIALEAITAELKR